MENMKSSDIGPKLANVTLGKQKIIISRDLYESRRTDNSQVYRGVQNIR